MTLLKKITLQELESFVHSKTYIALKNKPISRSRALSYVNNPRANKNDIVLYMLFLNDQLVAYRTILTDAFLLDNNPKYFGWLSGNWVAKKHRRKGFSTLLFNEVLKDWNNELMYTNYAEASKLVYDKTKQFELLKSLTGTKYYLRFCLSDILLKKRKLFMFTNLFWLVLDVLLNVFLDIKKTFKKQRKNQSFYVKKNKNLSDSILKFTDVFTIRNLFARGEKEFYWIQNYPWILTDNTSKLDSKHYNFSSYSKSFKSDFYTIYNTQNVVISCLLITVRDGHLKIPYTYFSKRHTKEVVAFIVDLCEQLKIKTIVIYKKELEDKLNSELSPLTSKVFIQNYFITKSLKNFVKTEQVISIDAGDGDAVFT